MSKIRVVVLAVCLSCFAIANASGQESARPGSAVGLGLGIGKTILVISDLNLFTPFAPAIVSVPIRFSDGFMLEPQFGLVMATTTEEGDSFKYTDRITQLHVGVGAFGLLGRGDFELLIGGRFGFVRNAIKEKYESDSIGSEEETVSQNDFLIGPAIGAQYFFSRHFSLGGEASLLFYFVGDTDYGDGYQGLFGDDDESNTWLLATTGQVFARWYF